MGKTVKKSFYRGKLAAKDYIDLIILLMKTNDPKGGVCPCPGGYIHVHDNYFQSSSLKVLGQSMPNFMWSLFGKGER